MHESFRSPNSSGPAISTLPLLYHELREDESRYSYVTQKVRFAEHLNLYQRVRKQTGMLRPEITFDDGHVSNFELALPMLTERAIVARFFITVGWTGTRSGYMGWEQLRELHASGQQIGAHGWTHTLLTHLKGEALDRELRGAREHLENRLGCSIQSMSLPGGRFNRHILEACQAAGYKQIWTSFPRAEPYPFGVVLGRLNVLANMNETWLETLLCPQSGVLQNLQRKQRIKDAAKTVLGDHLYAKVWSVLNRQEPDAAPVSDALQRDTNI